MNTLRILLISSVLPRDTTGGEVVLYRHFSRSPELCIAIARSTLTAPLAIDDSQNWLAEDIIEIQANRLLTRLTRTRLSRWTHDFLQCFNTFHNTNQLRYYIKNKKPDIIITVAHQELCWLAQQIAQEFNIPLVTFFHDWWPDMANVHSYARKILTRRFNQLYQQSQLVFCVSEEMQQVLGRHPNALVLFPIPHQSVKEEFPPTFAKENAFTVIYAGTLSGIYGPMMQALCNLVQEYPKLQLKLFGSPLDWPDFLVQNVKANRIYGGFISRNLLYSELRKANALLVAMSFNPAAQMRVKTSFPSKIAEYCPFGKPIVIWGPRYCSAAQWGFKYQSALVVTSPVAQDLVKALEELTTQPQEQTRLAQKALEMAHGMFNPERIQRQFVEHLYQVTTRH